MEYFNHKTLPPLTSPPSVRPGLKENAFLLLVFGWSGWGLVIPSLLGVSKSKGKSSLTIPALLAALGVCLLYSIARFDESFLAKFILLLSAITILTVIDCVRGQFESNAVIHIINGGYLGVGLYFLLMKTYPASFPDALWQIVLPSAPQAFNMLLLCFLFQNLGSYVLWSCLTPANQSLKKWVISTQNSVNLSFIKTPTHQLTLFTILSFLGLISRLWNFSIGKIYYTEGSGVPFYISSFLAQFDRLYVVAWLYGYALWLQPQFRRSRVGGLTWLVIAFELLYQVLSGSKGRFFNFVILPMASVFILTKQKVAWRSVILFSSLGMASWLLLYPILVIYRNLLASISVGRIDPINIFNRALQVLNTYSLDTYIDTILTPFNRSGLAEQVVAMTSIIHYQVSQGSDLLWQRLLLFWVPRFIWLDKPTILSGNLVGQLSRRLGDEDSITAVLTTSPGELYIYYGLMGSALMVLVGLLFRWMNEAISPFKFLTPFRVAVFVAFLPLMQGFLGGSFEAELTGIILQLFVLYAVLSVVKVVVSSRP